MACAQCDKLTEEYEWRMFLGYRTDKDIPRKNGRKMRPPHVALCVTCLERVPKQAQRAQMGTLGRGSGRVLFLEKYRREAGQTPGFDSTDHVPAGKPPIYISVDIAGRRLRAAYQTLQAADTQQ